MCVCGGGVVCGCVCVCVCLCVCVCVCVYVCVGLRMNLLYFIEKLLYLVTLFCDVMSYLMHTCVHVCTNDVPVYV